ncbi:MAG: hypothetical protein PHH59_12305 [Methylovulum sp.]|uniref:hypothetical protein n=1 Tax=Methylovulum sp. TaxID=1916980 RepID=UPI0026231BF2|nr:hypothetical protein [Methylovulum sp.]MDD2724789.1 hypothetical protein [Methylovulum sp.]MDD5124609.1 hypothetical protein [Methylovulum sp.]
MDSLNYQKIFRGLLAIGILIIILLPHLVFELLTELFHLLFEWLYELGDILFEWVEITLDTVIEMIFETDLHDTQIIVFYILMSILGFGIYRLCLLIPGVYRRIHNKLLAFYLYHKTGLTVYWHGLSLLNKIKLIAMVLSISYLYIFFSF